MEEIGSHLVILKRYTYVLLIAAQVYNSPHQVLLLKKFLDMQAHEHLYCQEVALHATIVKQVPAD